MTYKEARLIDNKYRKGDEKPIYQELVLARRMYTNGGLCSAALYSVRCSSLDGGCFAIGPLEEWEENGSDFTEWEEI